MIKTPFFQQASVVDSSVPLPGGNKMNHTTLPKLTTSHEETEREYCYGGYHPIQIHDKLGPNKNYKILRKLGWGQFSTVWLAFDSINRQYVALKIVKSSQNYTEAALDEIKILERVNRKDPEHPGFKHLVKLHDWFYHNGPNGQHVVMAFEVLGESLCSLTSTFHDKEKYHSLNLEQFGKSYGGLPINIVKKITKQMCLALDYLHRVCGLIHTDIKPENVLIEIKDVEKFIELLDITEENNRFQFNPETPIKHSNPLPSPMLRSNSYVNTTPSKSKSRSKLKSCSSSTSMSSVNYYENYTVETSTTATSISPTLLPVTPSNPQHCCTITTSEPDSDDEEDLTYYPSPTKFGDYFELPKSFTFKQNLNEQDLEDLEASINIKIADFGNACYYNYHFTNNIQTRQYRSPEIILGSRTWGASADCWSLGCLVFELITGDFLFNPSSSENFNRDDDHLAQIIELLDPSNQELLSLLRLNCKYRDNFFKIFEDDINGDIQIELRKIKKLKIWSLNDVLIDKYNFSKSDAMEISEFLLPLLRLRPKDRVDLGGWSNHKWLNEDFHLHDNADKIDRECGSCGRDIKGWYKTYVKPDHHHHHHHSSSK